MYKSLRPFIFKLDPEQAHHITLKLLALPIAPLLAALFNGNDSGLAVTAFGLNFRNPIGLAAGYDKNGTALRGLAALGFGHLEVGTVTRSAQPGNPRPRIFRLPADEALINRMGFPNEGVDNFVGRVKKRSPTPPGAGQNREILRSAKIGINIGKSKDTPLEKAGDDYCTLLTQVAAYADYVAINISSPNTPGLRQLQTKTFFNDLLQQIAQTRTELDSNVSRPWPKSETSDSVPLPILIKIAPDLTWPELDDILNAILTHKFDGIIATNTTLSREGLRTPSPLKDETGGLSGQPVRERSTEMIRYIHQHTEGKLPIIGVGGINSAAAALEKLDAGATLVQIYTGLIYEGPGLVKAIKKRMKDEG